MSSKQLFINSEEKITKMEKRFGELPDRPGEIRSKFGRDYTRLLHSTGYRRLKHKTQVFFAPQNDHICTRIEHVNHVESVSFTIAKQLALDTELTKAISIGHDIGHAPFGHLGERIIKEIAKKELGENFWHEKNGLHIVDDIELLEDDKRQLTNLSLTYAVRDGIISHCGEINQNGLKPRDDFIDLKDYQNVNQYSPYTWEGCVVKLADKIAYLGRDIEDAIKLKIISPFDTLDLLRFARKSLQYKIPAINTTILMHEFITDLCKNSSPQEGLRFSDSAYSLMQAIMTFNYENIYRHSRLDYYKEYATTIINTLFNLFMQSYNGYKTRTELETYSKLKCYSALFEPFKLWISKYWDLIEPKERKQNKFANHIVYNISGGEKIYKHAILDYISGMTDLFAIRMFEEINSFK